MVVIHTVPHLLLEDMVLSLMANLDMELHPPLVDTGHHPTLVDMGHHLPLVDMEEHHPPQDMERNLRQLGMEHTQDMAHSSLLNRTMLLKVPY